MKSATQARPHPCFPRKEMNGRCRQRRAGVSTARVGAADALLALTRSLGRRDACPTLRFMRRENPQPVAGEFRRTQIIEHFKSKSEEMGWARRGLALCKSTAGLPLPTDFMPKAALKTHALQTLTRIPDALLQREASGVRASSAPLFLRRSFNVWFRRIPSLGERAGVSVLLAFLLALPSCMGAENSANAEISLAFDAGNKLYAQGKFAEAAGAYEKLTQSGTVSPALYFNLGNACFKASQLGRAIAAYRHAERLTPRDPDIGANLQFARNQVQGPTLRPGRWERWLGTLNLNEWTGLAGIALWLTFGLLTLRELRPHLARSLRTWTLVAGAGSAMLIACLTLAWTGQSRHQTAIVTVKEATVRNGPLDESPSAFTANDGAELRVLDRKDDWLQVTDGTRRVGWVKRDSALVSPSS